MGKRKKNMLAEFDQWKKTHGEPRQAQKSLLCDAGKSIACPIELASPEFAGVQVDARGLQNFLLPPQKTVVSGRAGKTLTTETRPAATAPTAREDWRRAFRNILRAVSGEPQKRESNCSGVQLAGRGDWRVLLMLPFAGRAKWRFSGGDGEKQSL